MRLLLLAWVGLAALCVLSGWAWWWLLARVAPRTFFASPRSGQLFWLGLGCVLVELQLCSLFHPLDRSVLILLLLIAAAALPTARPLLGRLRQALRPAHLPLTLCRAGLVSTFALMVARAAVQPITWHDTLSTHIQQVKWAATYAVPPGLANLNPKLGFDQAHHLLAAIVDVGPLSHRSAHVVVGFLMFCVLAQWVMVLTRPARSPSDARAKVYAALTLPYLVGKVMTHEVASLSGDLAMSIVLIAGTLEWVRLPTPTSGLARRRRALGLVTIGATGAMVFAVKFSGLAFSVAAVALLLGAALRGRLGRKPSGLALALALPTLLIAGTMIRRIVLSGWPLFPVSIAGLGLSWSVSAKEVANQYCWIKSWARLPGVGCHEVLDGPIWRWFVPWFASFRSSHELMLLIWSGACLIATASGRVSGRKLSLPVCVALISVGYWFLGAPDVRFGGAFFWVLFACAAGPLLWTSFAASSSTRVLTLGLTLWLTSWNGGFDLQLPTTDNWTEVPAHPVAETLTEVVDQGLPTQLELRVPPPSTDVCGDAALPCTNRSELPRLRRPGDLGGGFVRR